MSKQKTYLLPIEGNPPPKAYQFNTNGYNWIIEGYENASNWLNRFEPKANGIWVIENPRYKKFIEDSPNAIKH